MFDQLRMRGFWIALSLFVPAIFLWWLVVFLVERYRQAPSHRRVAGADLLLLCAALLWGSWAYAAAAERLPREYFPCDLPGIMAICAGPKPGYFWGALGFMAVLFLIGLRQRLKSVRRRTNAHQEV